MGEKLRKNVRTQGTRLQLEAVARKYRNLGSDYDAAFRRGASELPANPTYSQMEATAKKARKEARKSRDMTITNEMIRTSTPLEGQTH